MKTAALIFLALAAVMFTLVIILALKTSRDRAGLKRIFKHNVRS